MALPETDLEHVLHGDPLSVEGRLRKLGLLSAAALSAPEKTREMVADIQAKYNPEDTGPSYVHELARRFIALGMASETAVALHERGPRSYVEREADRAFLEWIGEEKLSTPPATAARNDSVERHRARRWWEFWK